MLISFEPRYIAITVLQCHLEIINMEDMLVHSMLVRNHSLRKFHIWFKVIPFKKLHFQNDSPPIHKNTPPSNSNFCISQRNLYLPKMTCCKSNMMDTNVMYHMYRCSMTHCCVLFIRLSGALLLQITADFSHDKHSWECWGRINLMPSR